MKAAMFNRPAEPTPATADAPTMTAIVHNKYGTTPDDVLHFARVAKPPFGDDEVLVRVMRRASTGVPGTS